MTGLQVKCFLDFMVPSGVHIGGIEQSCAGGQDFHWALGVVAARFAISVRSRMQDCQNPRP